MKTRCKPGDIAIIVNQRNPGKLVSVIRSYERGTLVDGSPWHSEGRPGPMWVIESLGGPLQILDGDTGALQSCATAAISDSCLRPLRDGKGSDQSLAWKSKVLAH